MTLSIMTLSIMTLSIMTLSIMTLSIITFSIVGLCVTISINNFQHQRNNILYLVRLSWFPLYWVPLCWVPLWCVFHFIYRYAECRGAIKSRSSVSLSVSLKWFMLLSVVKCAVKALSKNCAQNYYKNWQHLPIFIEIFWMKFTHAFSNIYNSKFCFQCQKLTR